MQKHNKKRMEGGKDNKQQLYQGTSNADILTDLVMITS